MASRRSRSKAPTSGRKAKTSTGRTANRAIAHRADQNGLQTFAMHSSDEKTAPMLAQLREERSANAAFAAAPAELSKTDPETVASRYLRQALESKSIAAFTAP